MKDGKTTFALFFGNRGFFPASLEYNARRSPRRLVYPPTATTTTTTPRVWRGGSDTSEDRNAQISTGARHQCHQ